MESRKLTVSIFILNVFLLTSCGQSESSKSQAETVIKDETVRIDATPEDEPVKSHYTSIHEYGENFESQKKVWNKWLRKVKEMSEIQ